MEYLRRVGLGDRQLGGLALRIRSCGGLGDLVKENEGFDYREIDLHWARGEFSLSLWTLRQDRGWR